MSVIAFHAFAEDGSPLTVSDARQRLLDLQRKIEVAKVLKKSAGIISPQDATARITVRAATSNLLGSAFVVGCSEKLNAAGKRNCLVVTVAHNYRVAPGFGSDMRIAGYPAKLQFSKNGKLEKSSRPALFIGGNLSSSDVAFAVMEIGPDERMAYASLPSMDYVSVKGQTVIQFGYPDGSAALQMVRRTIKDINPNKGLAQYRCAGATSGGNSGGLLADADGNAIGICANSYTEGNEALFTSFKDIHDLAAVPQVAAEIRKYGLENVFTK